MKVLLLLGFVSFSYGEIARKLKLSSGYEIPTVGLGTFELKEDEIEKTIASALQNGYRYFDTTLASKNEAYLGKAFKKWFEQGGKREELFISTKLPPYGNRPQSVEKYLKRSLENFGFDYIDMYLIQAPFAVIEGDDYSPKKLDGKLIVDNEIDQLAVWKEMEKQVKAGKARSIGLSNFNQTQVQRIYDSAEIKPSNLQVEYHAYLQQKKLQEFCKQKNIIMTAYAPLGSMKAEKDFYAENKLPILVEVPLIKELAQKYNKSPAQILLRYSIQNGLAVIPLSKNSIHQKENMEIFDFELSPEDFMKIESLDLGEKGRIFDFSGYYTDVKKNPEYPFQANSN